jgi:hypothetical protein
MLFQVVHTHTHETCPGGSSENAKRFDERWQPLKKSSRVKVPAGCVSPTTHTFHTTVEADDYPNLARAPGSVNTHGTGRTSPILTLDQTAPMVEAGAFRVSR